MHESSIFLTATYDKEHLPSGENLCPRDVTLFLKRLRAVLSPAPVRYYAVGEYGEKRGRPHYHFALFGVSPDAALREVWGMGDCHVGTLEEASASYVAGYVTKRMTSWDDPRLKGRHPEFARMSLRPGIGAGAMLEVARVLETKDGALSMARTGDVAGMVRASGSKWPLGRYLRAVLRGNLGMDSGLPVAVRQRLALERVVALWEVADREALEGKRVQVGLNAIARSKIADMKRGAVDETL